MLPFFDNDHIERELLFYLALSIFILRETSCCLSLIMIILRENSFFYLALSIFILGESSCCLSLIMIILRENSFFTSLCQYSY